MTDIELNIDKNKLKQINQTTEGSALLKYYSEETKKAQLQTSPAHTRKILQQRVGYIPKDRVMELFQELEIAGVGKLRGKGFNNRETKFNWYAKPQNLVKLIENGDDHKIGVVEYSREADNPFEINVVLKLHSKAQLTDCVEALMDLL